MENPETIPLQPQRNAPGVRHSSGERHLIELQRCWAWVLMRWDRECFLLCPPHGSLETGPNQAPSELAKGTRTNLLHFLPL